jgi:ribosomal protein S18 acetylase RimI-like enzyme
MATIRPMSPMDMLKFNPCNLDHLTETYNISFYLDYFRQWPHLCKVIEGPSGQIEAYSGHSKTSLWILHKLMRKFSSRQGRVFTISCTGRTL